MRTLIFLFFGLFLLTAMFVVKRLDAGREKKLAGEGDSKPLTLKERLEQSAVLYRTAAGALPADRIRLRKVISGLADRCRSLATRARFPRKARMTIIRLLLSLNDVIERVTAIERSREPSELDALSTDKAVELIAEATEALGVIADRADDVASRRLEADLDVLKDRLDALR